MRGGLLEATAGRDRMEWRNSATSRTCFVIVEESTTNKIPLEPGPYFSTKGPLTLSLPGTSTRSTLDPPSALHVCLFSIMEVTVSKALPATSWPRTEVFPESLTPHTRTTRPRRFLLVHHQMRARVDAHQDADQHSVQLRVQTIA